MSHQLSNVVLSDSGFKELLPRMGKSPTSQCHELLGDQKKENWDQGKEMYIQAQPLSEHAVERQSAKTSLQQYFQVK